MTIWKIKQTTIDFSPEELQAVLNLIEYAMKDIWTEDEPLIEVVYNKFYNLTETKC